MLTEDKQNCSINTRILMWWEGRESTVWRGTCHEPLKEHPGNGDILFKNGNLQKATTLLPVNDVGLACKGSRCKLLGGSFNRLGKSWEDKSHTRACKFGGRILRIKQ